jgi:hypothetical protein
MYEDERRWRRALLVAALVVLVLTPTLALANPQGGKMPLSNFFRDLYEEGVGTWVPMLCFFILIMTVCNWFFGWVEVGPGLIKMVLAMALLGGGTAMIMGIIGGNVAAAPFVPFVP